MLNRKHSSEILFPHPSFVISKQSEKSHRVAHAFAATPAHCPANKPGADLEDDGYV